MFVLGSDYMILDSMFLKKGQIPTKISRKCRIIPAKVERHEASKRAGISIIGTKKRFTDE